MSRFNFGSVENPVLGVRSERFRLRGRFGFRINPHHRLRAGKAIANPRTVSQHQLHAVGANHLLHSSPGELPRITLQLISELLFYLGRQAKVISPRIKGTNFTKYVVNLLWQRLAAPGHGLTAEQTGQDPVFFRDVVANGNCRALLPADGDLGLLDRLAAVLEPP